MTDYTLAIFDMDKVLYDFDQRLRLRLVSELTGRPDQAIDAAVYGGPEEARAEAGDPDTAEAYLAQYAKKCSDIRSTPGPGPKSNVR